MTFFRTKWFDKDLGKLPEGTRKRVLKGIKKFRDKGRGDVKQVENDIWRLRIGDQRIFYWESDKGTYLLAAEHREDVYTRELINALLKRRDILKSD